jgi:hypothetical protein
MYFDVHRYILTYFNEVSQNVPVDVSCGHVGSLMLSGMIHILYVNQISQSFIIM